MATSPEERKRGNRSPGTNTTQSGDGKIDLTVGVGGKGDSSPQPKSKTLRITQPVIPSGNFGEILTGSNSPNPTPEGGTGQVSITVQNKFPADSGLNGQYRHIYSTSASGLPKKVVGPWITFPVGGVTSASFVWNCPADIDNKSNIEVRTVYTPSKSILYTKRIPVSTTDQLLPPTFTSLPVLSTSTPILGNTISVSGFVGSGNPVPSASYQWYQNSSAVSGATSASFTTTATGGVSAEVILTNSQGTLSATAGAIVGTIPSFIITPSASATGVTLGTTVTINNIGTTGSQPITYSYEWRMTSPTATPIAGATSQSYTTGISGTTLYGRVLASNNYATRVSTVDFGIVGVAPSFYIGDSGPIFANPSINNKVGDTVNVRGIYYNGVPVPGATATVTDSIGSRTVDASIVDTGTLNNEGKKTEQFEIRNTSDITVTINIGNVHGTSASSVVFNNISPANAAASFLGTPSASATNVNVGTSVSINNAGATGWPVPSSVYEWTQNSSVVSGATLVSYTPSATGPLSGKVTINNTSGGATSATVSFGTIAATGSSNFAPYFSGTPAGSTTNPDVGERMTFLTYGSTGLPAPATSFQWFDDGVAISGATGYGYVLGATGEIVDAEVAYVVTNNGSSNYIIDGAIQPVLSMTRGVQYTFDLSGVSTSHPFRLATTENGSGGQYTTGWTTNGTQGQAGANAVFIVPADAPATLYYYCGNHNGMGNSINVRTVPATDVTMTGNLTGFVTLTNSEGTTGATIDYGTMLNANITNLSLSNVVAGGTLTATVTYGGTFATINWSGVTS